MSIFIANIAVATRLYAIRAALDYSLSGRLDEYHHINGPLWRANMDAWKLVSGLVR